MEKIFYEKNKIKDFIEKRIIFDTGLSDDVRKILYDVKYRGDRALLEYTKKFDKVSLKINELKVSKEEITKAVSIVSNEIYESLNFAKENIISFQKKSLFFKKKSKNLKKKYPYIENLFNPLERVGIYVPGGRAPLVSTVLMTVLPAKVAGVKEIAIATPPQEDGNINPYILSACDLCGVDEIYKIGGAQAIAGLGFGTENIKKVDKIVGPGNIYVTLAKKEMYGYVDIDMVAGPSEILIFASSDNNPDWVSADLLSQAEHDEMSACFLICFSEEFALEVEKSIEKLLNEVDTKQTAKKSLDKNGKIFIVSNNKEAIEIINKIAPEHLELMLEEKEIDVILPKIKNAGTVFLGKYTPEAMGDYVAGPSHVLPTTGSARFFSGLSVSDFYKSVNIISYDKDSFKDQSKHAKLLASLEGLSCHKLSLDIRL